MRRHVLGIIAAGFLLAGLALGLGGAYESHPFEMGICVRVGLVLSATWLAWPQLAQLAVRTPRWLPATVLGGGLLVAVRPKSIFLVFPLLVAIGLLHFAGRIFKPPPRRQRRRHADSPRGKNGESE